ncbi:MAG: ComEC/Rec2 family competence protein, partial [Chloroflexota bacterium]|nr:ComEC/Rec2 family competence protein [Chloroflexota bacterium]
MWLYAVALGWLAGIWYAARWDSPPMLYVGAACLALAALLLGRADRRLVLGSVFLLALTVGAVRMDRAFADELLHHARQGEMRMLGVVDEQRARGVYVVKVRAPAPGSVLVYAPGSKLRAGDLLQLRGTAVPEDQLEPYERGMARSTAAAVVLRRPGIQLLDFNQAGPFTRTLWGLRGYIAILLERHLPTMLSPVAEGLLLGGSVRLDPELRRAFRESGTSHILAASGYNISMLAALMLVLLRPMLG